MKAILEFNLDDFDDNMNHRAAVKAQDMAFVLHEIRYNMKKDCCSQADRKKSLSNEEAIEIVFENISDLMYENGIIVDDLIN